jgi:predicted nucleotidyltransferase
MDKNYVALKVLVGSQAHGLANELSDFDYRGVFIVPSVEFFKLDHKIKNTSWIEGDEDNTLWELGYFLSMALKCNPTILEVFHAPIVETGRIGVELRDLFKHLWTKDKVLNSHLGYGASQRKKFLEDKDLRGFKYATAWLRTVYQAYNLFTTGEYTVNFKSTPVYEHLLSMKASTMSRKDAFGICEEWEEKLKKVASNYQDNPDYDPSKVEEFLINTRLHDSSLNRNFWDQARLGEEIHGFWYSEAPRCLE